MCGVLFALISAWCILALALSVRWANGIVLAALDVLIVVAIARSRRKQKRRTQWINSGAAAQRCIRVEGYLANLAHEIKARLANTQMPSPSGGTLSDDRISESLRIMAHGAREIPSAAQRLEDNLLNDLDQGCAEQACVQLRDLMLGLLREREALQALQVEADRSECQDLLITVFSEITQRMLTWIVAAQIQIDRARSHLSPQPCRVELNTKLEPIPESEALINWLTARGWIWPAEAIPVATRDNDLLAIALLSSGLWRR